MTTIKSRHFSSTPAPTAIDAGEAQWAVRELAALITAVGADSPVAMVLRQARRELASLTSAPATGGTVVGPFRIAA